MKKLIFFCSVLALGTAKPNGYYHQEYSYKSSSSSFKNNELQHKKDDEGFYAKDGDTEGRLKPKVSSQSQHSEYTNPKLLGGSGAAGYQAGGFGSGNSANYMASSDRLFGGLQNGIDGYASADRVLDLTNAYNTRGYDAGHSYGRLHGGSYATGSSNYGYTQGGSSYGYSQLGNSQGSYATNANLNSLMQRLQDDMTRQLQHAIYKQYQSSGYSTSVSSNQMNADIRLLEDELRRNLTRQLQDSLRTQYGSNTYSIVEGRPVATVPSYSSQELAALTRRLEDDLITKLHQNVRTTYNQETSNSYISGNTYRPVYPSSTLRPYYERPVITTPRDMRYSVTPNIITYPVNVVVESPTNIRYTPVPNPESLTHIASKTQAEVNSNLDIALENLYSTYLQSGKTSYYTIADFDNEVNRIKDEIMRNLTYNLDDLIRRNYGQQILKDDYYYTISSNGDISTQSNYNLRDYESLKKQVEDNLLRKLNQTVNTYRDQYQRRQSQYRESSSNTYTVTYRPTYYSSGNQIYDYSDLQRQLSQQLQNALNKHKYSQSSSYSASTSYNPQAYQTSLNELTRELQRNLTEQLGSFRASSGSSSSYSYSSGSGNADFESMKNQLQNQLMQQLRQGLQNQYQYSASASYSASSSSSANSNYGMRQAYGSYPSTCLHGCGRRRRRDLQYSYTSGQKRHGVKNVRRVYSTQAAESSSSPRYLHHPEELSYPQNIQTQEQSSYSKHFTHSSRRHSSQSQEDQSDIVEDLGIIHPPSSIHTGQVEDDLQQLEEIPSKHSIKYAKQDELPQLQLQETQPLQSIQDDLNQKLEVAHQTSHKILKHSGKLESHHDLTQQWEIPSQRQLSKQEQNVESHSYNQQISGQQLEDQNFEGLLHKPRHIQEIQRPLKLTQQTIGQQLETQNLVGHLQKPKYYNQEIQGQLELKPLQKPKPYHQEIQTQLELEQKTSSQQLEDWVGHLHKPKHYDQDKQKLEQQALSQQLEDQNLLGHFYSPKHRDQISQHQLEQKFQQLLEQQTLGQQLEDQNLLGQLHLPKRQNQQILSQQLEDQNLLLHQGTPNHFNQGIQRQQTLGQQLEDQNLVDPLNVPTHHKDIQDQVNLHQKIISQQLEDQNLVGQLTVDADSENNDDQKIVGQPNLEQQLIGQQLEDQNLIGSNSPKQNQVDLTQQLEEMPSQQLEIGNVQKPQHSFQHLQKPKDFDILKQENGVYEQQLTNEDDLQHPKYTQELQRTDDLTQQLELENHIHLTTIPGQDHSSESRLVLHSTPKTNDQQVEVEDHLTQQLEELPKLIPTRDFTQQIEDDSIELPHAQLKKIPELAETTQIPHREQLIDQTLQETVQKLEEPVQQLEELGQKLEEPDQQLEELGQKLEEPDQTLEKLGQKLEEPVQQLEELGQKIEKPDQKLEEPVQQLEEIGQKFEKSDQKLEEPVQQLEELGQILEEPDQKLEKLGQKLEEPVQQLEELGQKLEEPDQKLEEPVQQLEEIGQNLEKLDQKSEEPVQQLEALGQKLEELGQKLEEPDQQLEQLGQKLEEPDQTLELDQKLELSHQTHKPKQNIELDQEQQQLEKDIPSLELSRGEKPSDQDLPTLESGLSYVHETAEPELVGHHKGHPLEVSGYKSHSESTFKHNSQVSQLPSLSLGGYRLPNNNYRENFNQRPFTNGHSGHFTADNLPSLGTQTHIDTYQNALKQQDALIDLLNRKVEDSHTSNYDVYGKRTIKKTVFVNGKAVENQERSQLIKPNGEVVDIGNGFPSKHTNGGQFETYFPTQSSGYTNNWKTNYQINENPHSYIKNHDTFTQEKSHFENPFSRLDTGLYSGPFQGSEFSGKATRRTVHYVNGKPVSASEKIQILTPNGEIIEQNHDLPTSHIDSFMHGTFDSQFGQNIGPIESSHNSKVSKHTIKKTSSRYVNGKLVDFSSSNQDVSPTAEVTDFSSPIASKSSHSIYNSGVKTPRYYRNLGY